jgi:hypothetical protein
LAGSAAHSAQSGQVSRDNVAKSFMVSCFLGGKGWAMHRSERASRIEEANGNAGADTSRGGSWRKAEEGATTSALGAFISGAMTLGI